MKLKIKLFLLIDVSLFVSVNNITDQSFLLLLDEAYFMQAYHNLYGYVAMVFIK